MHCGHHVGILWLLVLGLCVLLAAQGLAAEAASGWATDVHEFVERLHRASLDPDAVYRVEELYLRRDALRLELTHGTLLFLQPVAGRVTGAVFVGEGRILVMPAEHSERQQLARFTGSPILAETFSSAYVRFTDATEAEWRAQIAAGRGSATQAPDLLAQWNGVVQAFNPVHSLRVLLDLLSQEPKPYFSALLTGQRLGRFEAFVDARREEEVLVGQTGWRQEQPYYDVWCSFSQEAPSRTVERRDHRVDSYRIQTTVQHDHSLDGTTEVRFRTGTPGDRMVLFDLSRFLQVEGVSTETGEPLPFFQNETLEPEQLRTLGSDQVVVVFPHPLAAERLYTLRFRYHGRVISELGNGVLYVGARGIWYPSLWPSGPAPFEMEFRYPRALVLVASGSQVATSEEGPWRVSHWRSAVPISMAGFNLGAYESHTRVHEGVSISVHANQQLEPVLAQPLTQPSVEQLPSAALARSAGIARRPFPDLLLSLPRPLPPRPAALVKEVGDEVAQALDFFVSRFGPFPYPQLSVSQIPGQFGQGFPGLLYVSTFTFLRGAEQTRLGLSERLREHFSGLVPVHETAHQWWGNRVRVANYRDQWLVEALATYSSLLYLEQKAGTNQLSEWLQRYRDDLLVKSPSGEPWDAVGPLALGLRLNSSLSPGAFESIVYPKGPWVLHMLRHLLSDSVFFALLRDITARYGEQKFSATELQALAEHRMPPAADVEATGRLDWFFDQWVNNTGIPHFRLQTRVEARREGGFRVTGTIQTRGVTDLFTMPVPLYARKGRALTPLGRVVVSGPETSFTFVSPTRPDRLVLDPHQTVLCVIE